MSHTRVKTTYECQGFYTGTEICTIYCHHNHSSDSVVFYNEDGEVEDMVFDEWSKGKDKWDAMIKLWSPFKGKWGDELLEGVEYWYPSELEVKY